MMMEMQSVFVMGGEDLSRLPEAYANVYLDEENFTPWNDSEIDMTDHLRPISFEE
jgi:hypothetical protein